MRLSIICLIFAVIGMRIGFSQGIKSFSYNDTIPFDSAVRKGRLSNGLTYYIRRSADVPAQARMALVVKAGSVLEDDDQLELAHLLEHLGFTSTRHFVNVWSYLDSLGLQRGSDANAATGLEETLYWVRVPTSGGLVSRRNLFLLEDFAQGMLLKTQDINRERGVIVGEFRRAWSKSSNIEREFYLQVYGDSRYGEISGNSAVRLRNIQHFGENSLRRFYNDWYRPDLQAVIIVGDVDVTCIERQIMGVFGTLQNPSVCRNRLKYEVPLSGDSRFFTIIDSGILNTEIKMLVKRKLLVCNTIADYKKRVEQDLYAIMMRERFAEIHRQYLTPFISTSYTALHGIYPGLDVWSTYIVAKPGEIRRSFEVVMKELERVVRYGFTEKELSTAKTEYSIRKMAHREQISLDAMMSQYIANFLRGEAVPNAVVLRQLDSTSLCDVTLQDVHACAKDLISEQNSNIIIRASENERVQLPDESTVRSWLAAVKRSELTPYRDEVIDYGQFWNNPIAITREASDEVQRVEFPEIGVTKVCLKNGATLLLKPHGVDNLQHTSKISMYAVKHGGASLYSSGEEYFAALWAADIVQACGIAGKNRFELNRILSAQDIEFYPFIRDGDEGFVGKAKSEHFDRLMQLVYYYFTTPEKDSLAFLDWKDRKRNALKYVKSDPQIRFYQSIDSILGSGGYNGRPSEQNLESLKLDTVYRIYREIFSKINEFTFVLVGNFDVEKVVEQASTYLGNLPAGEQKSRLSRLSRVTKDCHAISQYVYTALDTAKASIHLQINGSYHFNTENNALLEGLQFTLQNMLTRRLRDVEGATYDVRVVVDYSKVPRGRFRFVVDFDSSPRDVQRVMLAFQEELEQIRKMGPSIEMLNNMKAAETSYASWHRDSDFWMNYLVKQIERDADVEEISKRVILFRTMTRRSLQRAARAHLKPQCLSWFVLMSEESENSVY